MMRKFLIAIAVLILVPVVLFLTAWLYPRPVRHNTALGF